MKKAFWMTIFLSLVMPVYVRSADIVIEKDKDSSLLVRKLTLEEISAFKIDLPKVSIINDMKIIKETLEAFEIDLDKQGSREIVIERLTLWGFQNDEGRPIPDMTEVLMRIYKRDGKKLILSYKMASRSDQYLNRRFEIEDIDQNGFPEILLWSEAQGSFGGQRLDIYEWNEGKKDLSSNSFQSLYLKLIDINHDGRKEIERGDLLDNSIDGAPSNAEMVLWSDFYSYASGSFVKANKNYPDYFRKLRDKSSQRLQSIKEGKADPRVLKNKEYYERVDREIIGRCKAILD